MLTGLYRSLIPKLDMAREGTRSATGNSKPRVFPVVDTEPAVKRTTKPKVVKKVAEPKPTSRAAAKPVGVTKKKAAPKKEAGVVKKVCAPPLDDRGRGRCRKQGGPRVPLGHGDALGILVVHVLTEAQVKAAVKETKKKVEKKADKAEKVLLSITLPSSPYRPLPPLSEARGRCIMATETWPRETVLCLETMDVPPMGSLDSSSATVYASSPSHNISTVTTQLFADSLIGGQTQGNQEEGDTRSGCLSHGVRVCLLPVTAPLPSQPDGLGGWYCLSFVLCWVPLVGKRT